jgi:hypothetical protein
MRPLVLQISQTGLSQRQTQSRERGTYLHYQSTLNFSTDVRGYDMI